MRDEKTNYLKLNNDEKQHMNQSELDAFLAEKQFCFGEVHDHVTTPFPSSSEGIFLNGMFTNYFLFY